MWALYIVQIVESFIGFWYQYETLKNIRSVFYGCVLNINAMNFFPQNGGAVTFSKILDTMIFSKGYWIILTSGVSTIAFEL